jgi:UDP-N-acetylglucosamine diphosphorylase/glucosamine-1-phosphate N-acetyltransferase
LINGRVLDLSWLDSLLDAPAGTVYESQGTLLAARLSPALASVVLYYLRNQQSAEALDELRRFGRITQIETPLCTYPWDLITQAGEQLERDEPLLKARLPRYSPDDASITVRGGHIYVSPTAKLDGPLVLDGRDGPIYIDDDAHIEPFSFIQGPAYIGKKSLISSALIRGETSIGPVCRIGGEVEASTIQGYSNKHHEGFLGHSWLGEWVNIGAMTTNSDLKNTYGSIKMAIEGQGQVDSGEIKLGCFLADHVKLGIGLHITGGAVVGTGSNLFGIHMIPKTVPPFTWGSQVFYEYQIDRMISVARKVMERRKQTLSAQNEAVLREVFTMTRPNRHDLGDTRLRAASSTSGTESLDLLARAEAEAERAYEHEQVTPSV